MSVYGDILTAVQTGVATVVSNTVLRKVAQVLKTDTLPLVVVAPGPDGEQIAKQTFQRPNRTGRGLVGLPCPGSVLRGG